ncbi:hypothetical protein DFH07DRAFT_801882 [Mycena maculata]|uniref:Uncharacterized protein n=1 Tax=Mycena maculata TaxID=230809 RepID=A0AAD7NS23_9AGAR|nr:hypothetical protein DFH07DRAFT_801882 [Mycena maculata]
MGRATTGAAVASSSKSSSTSPTKRETPPKPKEGLRTWQREWAATMELEKWSVDKKFVHPEGTSILPKGAAMRKFKLNQIEMATLPCEREFRGEGSTTVLHYSCDQLRILATRKRTKLGKLLEEDGPRTCSPRVSHRGGASRDPPALPSYLEHYHRPNPPPLKIPAYTSPAGAQASDPAIIIWEPTKIMGPVTVYEACRLYCINPEDIQDLSAYSPWIDLPTVAKRAVALHGGFHAHKALVLRHRTAEEDALDQAKKNKSDFTFSGIIWEQLDFYFRTTSSVAYEHPSQSVRERRVAVLYPIESEDQGDYGCNWEWVPFWGDF